MRHFLIAAFSVGILSVTQAQPPALGDPLPDLPEPPLRLKKKGQEPKKIEPAPDKDPDKLKPEDKRNDNDPPKLEDPPKLDDPPKLEDPPKLDDPDNLDEIPDAVPEQDEDQEILSRIAENTKRSEERLANKELGEGTRQVQKDIIDDLDKLINKQQNQQNQGGGGGGAQQQQQNKEQNPMGGGQPQGGAKPQGGKQGKQGGQKNQGRRGPLSRKPGGRRGQNGKQDQQQLTKKPQNQQGDPKQGKGGKDPKFGGNGGETGKDPNAKEKEFDLWGHLPERERMLMNRYFREKFMEKYEDETRKYYRRIAEKSRKK